MANEGGKYYCIDEKPYCKTCYEIFPSATKKRVVNYGDIERKAREK
jgi:hypothetical protein